MASGHCKLYDESLVRNIMVQTGLSIFEFMNRNRRATVGDICEYVEVHASSIIASTIEDLNRSGESSEVDIPQTDEPFQVFM